MKTAEERVKEYVKYSGKVSNEDEIVQLMQQYALEAIHLNLDIAAKNATASIIYCDPYDYSAGVAGAEVDEHSITEIQVELP